MCRHGGDEAGGGHPADAAVSLIRNIQVAGGVQGHAARIIQAAFVAARRPGVSCGAIARHGGDEAVADRADAVVFIIGNIQVPEASKATPAGP